MFWTIFGVVLFAFGSTYLWKPRLFRRGVFMRTSLAIRTFSEHGYTRYMRALGAFLMAVGVILIVVGAI